jgi:hypothetical protein
MSPFVSSAGYDSIANRLYKRNRVFGVYNYDTALLPLYLLRPEDVKVVLLISDPVNHESSPIPWVNTKGKLGPGTLNMLEKENLSLIKQRYDKFRGTNYASMRKNQTSESWTKSEVYWRLRFKREKELDYAGVLINPPFDTYNWYQQGVLIINLNWTGDVRNPWHSDIWEFFNKSLVFNLQRHYENIVFAAACYSALDYSHLISEKKHKFVSKDESKTNFFTDINKGISDLRGPKKMVNFILDGFNKKGYSFESNQKKGLETVKA